MVLSKKRQLKVLQFNTFYSPFLIEFYRLNPDLYKRSYTEQLNCLYRSGFSVIHNFTYQLETLDYETLFVVANCQQSQFQWLRENGFSPEQVSKKWPFEILSLQVNTFQPDVIISSDAFLFEGSFIRQLKWKAPLVIGWTGEPIPDRLDWRGYDLILSNFTYPRKKALEFGALETESFYPGFIKWLAEKSEGVQPEYDVVFVGQWSTLHQKRNEFLYALAREAVKPEGFKLGLYLLGHQRQMPEEVAACCLKPCFGLDMHRALRTGKIAVNAGILPEAGNMRLFETTGTGIFLLTEDFDNLEEYFIAGVEVETYSDSAEAIRKIYYYLEHEEERETIAKRGKERCWRDHSMAVQVEKLDSIIRSRLGIQSHINDDQEGLFGDYKSIQSQDDLSNVFQLAKECRFGRWKVDFRGLTIYCHDLMSFYMAAKDIFIHGIYTFKSSSLDPVVIDGGAHIGLFSLMIKKLYPQARIIMFEPDLESLYLLRKNIEANNLTDIEIIEAGLFDQDGVKKFSPDHSDGSSIFVGQGSVSIKVVRLRRFLENNIDFLKLNIEGAELEVLRDNEDLLSGIREMVIEYHGFHEIGQRLHEILAILDRAGFRYLIHDFDKLTNPATKPPFFLNEKSRFFLLIYAVHLSEPKTLGKTVCSFDLNVEPKSRKFGCDRGTPIDRYYINKFLALHASSISGQVMEIAESTYSRRYGSNIKSISVLSCEPGAGVDLVGNLATGENIPREKYDCVILTQTIQMIFDVKAAIRNVYASLKPGGTMLLTISGISQISRYDMDRWGEYWRLTDKGLESLLLELKPQAEIDIVTYGNVATAKAFLDGIAFEEMPAGVFDIDDADYQLLVAANVRKPGCSAVERDNAQLSQKDSMVLIYHRVADDQIDRNLLAVSPENFAEHLKFLAENFRVIPLRKFMSELNNGVLIPGTVSLTFDDGYLDNLTNAVPLLEEYNLHATIFVTTGMVGSFHEFWWDAMERIFLADFEKPLPKRIVFEDQQGVEKGWPTVSRAERLRAHDEICAILRNNSVSEINSFLERIFVWAGADCLPRKSHLVVNQDQLRSLASSSVIEIGAHTVNHSRLSTLPFDEQQKEIFESKRQLELMINKPVTIFSYPYGAGSDFSAETTRIVKNCGFEFGIANIQKDITLPVNMFAVPRRLVRNWRTDVFKSWITGLESERDSIEIKSRMDKLTSLSGCK